MPTSSEDSTESTQNSTAVKPGAGAVRVDSPRSSDDSVRGSDSAHININRILLSEKALPVIALCVSLVALVIALIALERSGSGRDLSEARYVDLVARNEATQDKAKLAERNATVAVERSHDLMARTGRIEAKVGLYSTDH
jgi:hypothetical protein